MRIESWDRTTLLEQERVIGRQKGSGAPNGLTEEFEELNLDLVDDKDTPLIDVDAHVRLASHQHLNGIEILRRGYNFTDGSDGFGHLDAGLFFIAFVRNPLTQFIPMQIGAGPPRCAQRVHHPHRQRDLRLPAGPARRRRTGVRRCSASRRVDVALRRFADLRTGPQSSCESSSSTRSSTSTMSSSDTTSGTAGMSSGSALPALGQCRRHSSSLTTPSGAAASSSVGTSVSRRFAAIARSVRAHGRP